MPRPFLTSLLFSLVALAAAATGAGCFTPELLKGGAGTNVSLQEGDAAIRSGSAQLLVPAKGYGLAGGTWTVALPLGAGGEVVGADVASLRGRTLAELRAMADAPVPPAIKAAADGLRRRVRAERGGISAAGRERVVVRLVVLDEMTTLIGYWPAGQAVAVPLAWHPVAWNEWRRDNLVEAYQTPDDSTLRPPRVAAVPATVLRPLPQRAAASAAAVALVPLAVTGDVAVVAAGVVTAPVWFPLLLIYTAEYVAYERESFRDLPLKRWHPPLVYPPPSEGKQ